MVKCPKCKKGELVLKTGETHMYVCENCHYEVDELKAEFKRRFWLGSGFATKRRKCKAISF
jgi:ssDNA-binding Zn-finger/Zn-ribbon topoisomerase 1